MLKITGDGRKAALDMRLVHALADTDTDTKLSLAVDRIKRVWALHGSHLGADEVVTVIVERPHALIPPCVNVDESDFGLRHAGLDHIAALVAAGEVTTARKMCACSTRQRSLRSLILQRGQLRPPFDPPEQERCSVHLTRRASPSGLPTGAISSAPGPSTAWRLRSPPGPPSTRRMPPWTCTRAVRPSTAAGLPRPCPTANRPDWMPP